MRPIENTIHAPTTNISKFLDEKLRPIFDDKCQETSIINGAHLLQQLHRQVDKGLITSTTYFCTFDIHNLFTMLPQAEAVKTIGEFLTTHGHTTVNNLTHETIQELASMVLQDNFVAYGDQIYRQKTGGAMGSTFTLTLANIFMWKWERRLVERQKMTGEFYGR